MALPTWDYGSSMFEFVDVSFTSQVSSTPKVVAYGETVKVHVTVKNKSGTRIKKVCAWGYSTVPTIPFQNNPNVDIYSHNIYSPNFYCAGTDYGDPATYQSVIWNNNTNMSFDGEILIKEYAPNIYGQYVNLPEYHWPANKKTSSTPTTFGDDCGIRFAIYTDTAQKAECYNLNLQGQSSELVHIISKRDNPKLEMKIARYPDDESTNVITTARLTTDTPLSAISRQTDPYSIVLRRSNTHDPATPSDPTVASYNLPLSALYNNTIVNSTTAITSTFGNGDDWSFLLSIDNGYEHAEAYCNIPNAFANVHLSGCSTGGVAFGKFSAATQNHPMFECEYPAYFNAGVFVNDIKDGDTLTLTGGTFFGYVTGSTRKIVFNVPIAKSLKGVTSASITALTANIANNGGYAISSQSVTGGSSYMGTEITRTVKLFPDLNVIEVTLERSTAWDLTNNDCINVRNETMSFTFTVVQ